MGALKGQFKALFPKQGTFFTDHPLTPGKPNLPHTYVHYTAHNVENNVTISKMVADHHAVDL